MRIAIFGSCVSRDTCEFIPDASVVAYVARQSVTSLDFPHGIEGMNLGEFDSPFQRRMVLSDLRGTGIKQVTKGAEDVGLVLIDLVDERRGFWLYPDGTSMTNSLEIEASGVAGQAKFDGARLVQFGSDEHFDAWKKGFEILNTALKDAGMQEKTVLLDLEWAAALEGTKHPQDNLISRCGRQARRLRRGTRNAMRALSSGMGPPAAWNRLRNVKPTEAEGFSDRAAEANLEYVRYRNVATALIPNVVTRTSEELRIDPRHKWGPEPFHYRYEDYRSIVESIQLLVNRS